METKHVVVFGAGKIGRSFIAQLFSKAGFKVFLIDADKHLVEQLNIKKSYKIIIKDAEEDSILVNNISALHVSQETEIIQLIRQTQYVATASGARALPAIAKIIAQALPGCKYPLDIILAENLRNAPEYFSGNLRILLPANFNLEGQIGLVETSIGKMVPFMNSKDLNDDPLQIFAEAYNTLILDEKAFLNPRPAIDNFLYKSNMKAWVDRKLFIHNFGHAATAYYANYHYPQLVFLYEALDKQDVYDFTFQSMHESAKILMQLYPNEFTVKHLDEHILDLINRFKNIALRDTIYRIGCDLKRKLGYYDRIVSPLVAGFENQQKIESMLQVYAYATCFNAKDENGHQLNDDIDVVNNFKNTEELEKNIIAISGLNRKDHHRAIELISDTIFKIKSLKRNWSLNV